MVSGADIIKYVLCKVVFLVEETDYAYVLEGRKGITNQSFR